MQQNHAFITGILGFVAMIAVVMYGVRTGSTAIAVVAILAGGALVWYLTRSATPVIQDEWTQLVTRKASVLTLNATSILFAIIGIILMTAGPGQDYDQASITIAAFLVTIAVIYLATTVWYSHTLRGTEP